VESSNTSEAQERVQRKGSVEKAIFQPEGSRNYVLFTIQLVWQLGNEIQLNV
jgi:hypothetical protein